MAHELPHRLPAVGRLLGPVVFGDLPAYRLENIGKPPRRELACLNRYCYGTSGNVLVYQPLSLLPHEKSTSGQCVQKCRYRSVWPCSGRGRSAAWGKRSMTSL